MRTVLVIILVVGILSASFAVVSRLVSDTPDVELAVSENNELTLTARQGQVVRIRLGGNATTGYQWTLASQTDAKGKACEILTPAGKIEYQPRPAEGRVGVGGEFLATFRAARAGLCKLTFAYRRPWEKDKKPIKTFTIHVAVQMIPSDRPATKPTDR